MDDDRPHTVFSMASRTWKFIISFAVCYGSYVTGVGTTCLSPLLLEFSSRFESSVEQVSKVLTIIVICYLLSALLGTVIFKFVDRQLLVILLLSLVASSFFLLPSASNLIEFFVYSSLIGWGSGAYETAQVAWIIDLWRVESPPWILCQHFAFSLGTLTSPLIIASFLSNNNNSSTNVIKDSSISSAISIHVPFYILGCMAILSVVVNLIIYFAFINRSQYVSIENNAKKPAVRSNGSSMSVTTALIPRKQNSVKRKIVLIGLSCFVIGFYSALQMCTQQFLPTYAHFLPLKLSSTEGAEILFGFQIGFNIGRLVGIFLVLKIRTHFIFVGNLIVLSMANTILFIWGGDSMALFWIGCVMMGLGMSTVYPTFFAFIEEFLNITETVSGSVTVAGGFVATISCLIMGKFVERSPEILVYVNYASIFLSFIAFFLLFSVTYMRPGSTRI